MVDASSAHESQPLIRASAPNRWRLGAFLLLMSQFFERLGFYGLTLNFIFFLNGDPFAWATYNAAALIFAFDSFSFLFSVIGAWLADAFLGKFRLLIVGYVFYLIFYLPLPFLYLDSWDGSYQELAPSWCLVHRNASNDHWAPGSRGFPAWLKSGDRWFFQERCSVVVTCCLLALGVGAAFIKAVITPFGADQVQRANTAGMRSFFNWYYWIVNAGTFFAHLVLAFLQVNISMFWGYLAGVLMIFLSLLLLLLAAPFLQRVGPAGSEAGQMVGVLAAGVGAGCCCCRAGKRERTRRAVEGPSVQQGQTAVRPRCLDAAKKTRGGRYEEKTVEDVKDFLHILLVFVCFIFYWACYFQIHTSFLAQGLHMRVVVFAHSKSLPVAWLSLFDVVAIVLLIPFLDSVVYPALARRGYSPSLYSRMLAGMALSTASMCVAGFVEQRRMTVFWGVDNLSPTKPAHSVNQTIGDTVYFAANMSIFYQIPQYALLGMGEAFTAVAGLEFAYTMAPMAMQSLVTGLFWLFAGVGSCLGVALVQSLQGWLLFSNDEYDINYRQPCADDPTRYCKPTRLDLYFFILAGLQVVGMILFVVVVNLVLPWCAGHPHLVHHEGQEETEEVLVVSQDSLLESVDSVSSQVRSAPPLRS